MALGFGGSFCVTDEAVSAKMGYDRVHDFHRHGVEYIVSADMSCLTDLRQYTVATYCSVAVYRFTCAAWH